MVLADFSIEEFLGIILFLPLLIYFIYVVFDGIGIFKDVFSAGEKWPPPPPYYWEEGIEKWEEFFREAFPEKHPFEEDDDREEFEDEWPPPPPYYWEEGKEKWEEFFREAFPEKHPFEDKRKRRFRT